MSEPETLARELLCELAACDEPLTEQQRLQQLLAHLLQFHKREEKPTWWQHYAWLNATEEELSDDLSCLGGLYRTERLPYTLPPSRLPLYEYSFDSHQETKLEAGNACYLAHDGSRATLKQLDRRAGTAAISVAKNKEEPPAVVGLLPDEYVSTAPIIGSIFASVQNWRNTGRLHPALDALLLRRAPRICGEQPGCVLVPSQADLVARTEEIVSAMDHTTLCIQGPPGTGKTYTAARAIVALVRKGKRVGISANSHKAILNLELEVARVALECGFTLRGMHVGNSIRAEDLPTGFVAGRPDPADLPDVIGGTAWAFASPALEGTVSHLFVDEAGQVSLANVAGMARATENLVLIGDQMQLSQPTQAVHPGASGQSSLEYLLGEHATVPGDFGIFLATSRRMHPALCSFISQTSYDGRLQSHPSTAQRHLVLDRTEHVRKSAGLLYASVEHYGNTQSSEEEVERIVQIVAELMSDAVRYREFGCERRLTLDDVVVMAPYNLQVRLLEERIPGIRAGSVDRFQGQEAPVAIYSMCASSTEDCSRGVEFLFSRNRTNVALSRAKALAILVGSPRLCSGPAASIEAMRLIGMYARAVSSGQSLVNPDRSYERKADD